MIMDCWRRQRSENHIQEGSRMRCYRSKPPLGNWQSTVPSWEKKFCWEVGAVPWGKLLETKKFISSYDYMLEWDSSAAEEAFNNAKARYWAGLNRLPCDIPLPDINAHIDNVDWNFDIDPELISDLDRDFVVSDDSSKGERVLIFDELHVKSHGLTDNGWDNGWGDCEDGFKVLTDSDLEKIKEESQHVYADMATKGVDHGGTWDVEDQWGSKVQENGDAGKNWWNQESGWNKWESKVNEFGSNWEDNSYNRNYRKSSDRSMLTYKTTGFHGEESRVNDGGYNGNNRNMSRYKTTRFCGDGQVNNQWVSKNQKDRRSDNFGHDQQPLCRPINHHGSAKQGNNWGWE